MAQYRTGTSSVVQDSAVVSGTGTLWLTNARAGDSFILASTGRVYDVASVDSDTQLTLTAPYRGATRTGPYAIQRDFTPDGFPEMAQGDIETAAIFTRAMRKIQSRFALVTGVAASGATTYPDTAAGLAATGDTEFFWVPAPAGLTLYMNDNGAAVADTTYPNSTTLQSAVDALSGLEGRILSLIESLHPELIGTTTRLDFLAQSYMITEAD